MRAAAAQGDRLSLHDGVLEDAEIALPSNVINGEREREDPVETPEVWAGWLTSFAHEARISKYAPRMSRSAPCPASLL